MKIRNSTVSDIDDIMKIYELARKFMRASGNDMQWTEGYPSKELILEDIVREDSYVCTNEDKIVGVFTYVKGEEPAYLKIEGKWSYDLKYGVIHRIGAATRGLNLGEKSFEFCLKDCGYLRIDTHESNGPMRRLLEKNGFKKCGVIYLDDGSERIAYDKKV